MEDVARMETTDDVGVDFGVIPSSSSILEPQLPMEDSITAAATTTGFLAATPSPSNRNDDRIKDIESTCCTVVTSPSSSVSSFLPSVSSQFGWSFEQNSAPERRAMIKETENQTTYLRLKTQGPNPIMDPPPIVIPQHLNQFFNRYKEKNPDLCKNAEAPSFVENPHPNDVLSGSGKTCMAHPGNERFRELVAANKETYSSLAKQQKSLFARKIVDAIHSTVGRFLSKDSIISGVWQDIGLSRSISKTSQALGRRTIKKPPKTLKKNPEHAKEGEERDIPAGLCDPTLGKCTNGKHPETPKECPEHTSTQGRKRDSAVAINDTRPKKFQTNPSQRNTEENIINSSTNDNESEYTSIIPYSSQGGIKVRLQEQVKDVPIVLSYIRNPDGTKGPAESIGAIKNFGDGIVAINGIRTMGMPFKEIMKIIKEPENTGVIALRLRNSKHGGMSTAVPPNPSVTATTDAPFQSRLQPDNIGYPAHGDTTTEMSPSHALAWISHQCQDQGTMAAPHHATATLPQPSQWDPYGQNPEMMTTTAISEYTPLFEAYPAAMPPPGEQYTSTALHPAMTPEFKWNLNDTHPAEPAFPNLSHFSIEPISVFNTRGPTQSMTGLPKPRTWSFVPVPPPMSTETPESIPPPPTGSYFDVADDRNMFKSAPNVKSPTTTSSMNNMDSNNVPQPPSKSSASWPAAPQNLVPPAKVHKKKEVYTIDVFKTVHGYLIDVVVENDGSAIFVGHRRTPDGNIGPTEKAGLFRNIRDKIVAVDSICTRNTTEEAIIELMKEGAKKGYVHMDVECNDGDDDGCGGGFYESDNEGKESS